MKRIALLLGSLLVACGAPATQHHPPVSTTAPTAPPAVETAPAPEPAPPKSRLELAKKIVEQESKEPIGVIVAADAIEGNARLEASSDPRAIVTWTDESRTAQSTEELVHVVTPLGDGTSKFEHILVKAPRSDSVGTRLMIAGLWPSMPGLETLRINDDGSREVRAIGYLHPYNDRPTERIYRPARHFSTAAISSVDRSFDLGARLQKEGERGRGRMIGPLRSMTAEHRAQTMVTAVGTCSDTTVTGVAVVVSGIARAEQHGSLAIAVTKIETTVHVAQWLAIAPRYTRVLRETAASIRRRGSPAPADAGPLRAFRADLAKSFGPATSLFEIDAILSGLIEGLARGSKETALDALRLRCRALDEEVALAHALGDESYVDVR